MSPTVANTNDQLLTDPQIVVVACVAIGAIFAKTTDLLIGTLTDRKRKVQEKFDLCVMAEVTAVQNRYRERLEYLQSEFQEKVVRVEQENKTLTVENERLLAEVAMLTKEANFIASHKEK